MGPWTTCSVYSIGVVLTLDSTRVSTLVPLRSILKTERSLVYIFIRLLLFILHYFQISRYIKTRTLSSTVVDSLSSLRFCRVFCTKSQLKRDPFRTKYYCEMTFESNEKFFFNDENPINGNCKINHIYMCV